MTFNEFKAWLEGYEEAFENGRPSDLQWKRIKERLEGIQTKVLPTTRDSQSKDYIQPFKAMY